MAALHAYRMARGLCKFCAEKYVRGHKCSPTVQLQAIHEVWDLFQEESDSESVHDHSKFEFQLHMSLSQEAVASTGSPKTLRFLEQIQGNDVVIFVDSRRSHSFINTSIAKSLKNVTQVFNAIKVQVANGHLICSTAEIKHAALTVQEHEFISNLKVIHLPYYDMILGIDWLEAHNPMRVDWLHKWMVISVNGEQLHLHELQHSLPAYSLVELHLMDGQQSIL
jgi:hypothetical protein